MKTDQHNFLATGNAGNVGLALATSLVTVCMLNQFPSESVFDKKWMETGLCIANEESLWLNTHSLCFYACVIFAAVLRYLYVIQPPEVPPIQKVMLSGAVMSIFGHGLAHAYLASDPTQMDLQFHLNNLPKSLAVTAMLLFAFVTLFQGVLPFASATKIVTTSIIITLGFTILNVEPRNNNAYVIAVIYISNSMHMLSLPEEHKKTATYALYPFLQLPVLVVGVLESIGCEGLLEAVGGHVIYDSTLAIGYIALELLSNYLEPTKKLQKLS